MKRLLLPALLLAACAPGAAPSDTDADFSDLSAGEYHPARVIIGHAAAPPALTHAGISLRTRSLGAGLSVVEVPTGEDALAMLDSLRRQPGVTFAEPDVVRTVSGEPFAAYQWHMTQIGAEAAWDSGHTGSGAVVAVIDTGVSGGGEDGFASLLAGYDFVDDDSSPEDGNGHGTHVAGTIAQAVNGIGVSGVAPDAAILPVRVLGDDGTGYTSDVVAGILYAIAQGADVINLSLGSSSPSSAEEAALAAAADQGVLVVAATGNDSNDSGINYPAVYDDAMAVAAVDYAGARTWYSNAGSGVDIAAPGGDTSADLDDDGYGDGVLQETIRDGAYGYFFYQGTSMATPHVAGAAAVLMAAGATAEQARELMEQTATGTDDGGVTTELGHGVLNLEAALAALSDEPVDDEPDEEDPTADTQAPSLTFFQMRPREDKTRFLVAADEPAKLTICFSGGPCEESALSERHAITLPGWSPTHSLWLTDDAGNVLERLEVPTRRPPPPRN